MGIFANTHNFAAGLKSLQFLVTCRMDATIYKTIVSLGKKGGKGSGKKKKRKKVNETFERKNGYDSHIASNPVQCVYVCVIGALHHQVLFSVSRCCLVTIPRTAAVQINP